MKLTGVVCFSIMQMARFWGLVRLQASASGFWRVSGGSSTAPASYDFERTPFDVIRECAP